MTTFDTKSIVAGLAVGLFFGVTATAVLAQQSDTTPAVVMEDGLAPTRTAPDGNIRVKALAEGKNAYFGMLSVAPGAQVPAHSDDAEEFLYVMKGTATIKIGQNTYDLKPGTTAYIPTNAETTLNNDSNKFTAIQVFAGPEPADKYTDWTVGGDPIQPAKSKRRKSKPNRSRSNTRGGQPAQQQ